MGRKPFHAPAELLLTHELVEVPLEHVLQACKVDTYECYRRKSFFSESDFFCRDEFDKHTEETKPLAKDLAVLPAGARRCHH